MIKLKKSKNADTRSASKKVSKDELLANSKQHIKDVQSGLDYFAKALIMAGLLHDHTKIENIDEFYKDFELVQQGKVADFKKMHWFKDIHLTERHHLTDYCPEDVTLFDVMERIADIVMAGMARTGKVYDDNLSPELLEKAYKNTVELLKKQILIEE